MPDHRRSRSSVFCTERQEPPREIATDISIECHEVPDTEAVKYREQQQGLFEWLYSRLGFFDQYTGPLHRRLRFGRGITFDVDERGDERDLKADLLATKSGRCLQGRDLVESTGELLCGFNQRRTGERSLPSLAPQASGFLNQPR